MGSLPMQQRSFGSAFLMRHSDSGSVDYILHTFTFEHQLPHIVVILQKFDIKISAIDVKFWMS
jgi:hypothetical protein